MGGRLSSNDDDDYYHRNCASKKSEKGTMENLLAPLVRPLEKVMLGKVIPLVCGLYSSVTHYFLPPTICLAYPLPNSTMYSWL